MQRSKNLQLTSNRKQQGVVIVVALFIVALVATMSYVMMSRLERDTRRTTLILRDTQAALYAQGSIAWAIDKLRSDWKEKKDNQLVDATPIKSPEDEVNGYLIQSTIYDMQGRFNLNNISDEAGRDMFKRLLAVLSPKLSTEQIDNVVKATLDWITPGSGQKNDSRYYTELPQPYRAAHRPMLSPSEWRLVKGVDAGLYNAVSPYLVALPGQAPINVQSASPYVLMLLGDNLDLSTAKGVELLRSTVPFVSREAFLNLDVIKNHPVKSDKITVISQFFLVETTVKIDQQRVVIYTLLKRVEQGKDALMVTLWQSKGVW